MARRAVLLWSVFVIVHVSVAWLGFLLPNQPMGDVYYVYEPWSDQALSGGGIVGVTEPWVYPQLALVPMLIAHVFAGPWGYLIGWAILVTLLNALGFALLVGRGRSTGRTVAAWFWLSYIALLGPIGMYRIDAVTVPIALAGMLWIVRRPWLGAALLTIGAWIKIWPAAIVAAAVIAVRRRGAVIGGAATVTGAVLGTVLVLGGAPHALGFVTEQTGRGLQIEAPVSTVYMWQAVAGVSGSFVYYDDQILTFQVTGAHVDVVIAMMTPLLALAALAVAGLGAYKAWRGASFLRLFPPLVLALVLTLIVFNKVGSPQFMAWLIAPLAVWLVLDRHASWGLATLGLGIAALTQGVYPLAYWQVLTVEPAAVALLTLRNVLLIVLLVWAVARLAAVPARSPRVTLPHPDAAPAAPVVTP